MCTWVGDQAWWVDQARRLLSLSQLLHDLVVMGARPHEVPPAPKVVRYVSMRGHREKFLALPFRKS